MDNTRKEFLKESGLCPHELAKLMGHQTRDIHNKPTNTTAQLLLNYENIRSKYKSIKPLSTQLSLTKPLQHYNLPSQNQFLNEWKIRYPEMTIQFIAILYFYLELVYHLGGFIQVVSTGKFPATIEKFRQESTVKTSGFLNFTLQSNQQIFKIYTKYLLPYEYQLAGINLDYKYCSNPCQQFQSAYFISKQELSKMLLVQPLTLNIFTKDITILKNCQEVFLNRNQNSDESFVTLDQVCKYYKKQKVDIRIQNPMDYGFCTKKLKNCKHQMTIGEYKQYQKYYEQPEQLKNFKHRELLKNGSIFFAVNFDPKDSKLTEHIHNSISNTFLSYKSNNDMLSYMDTDVPGCSIPQFYFKVKGCWTGGHQENINMCAININHGPDSSEWFSIDFKYVEDLRTILKKKFGIDLYQQQGLWYEKISWFLQHGFPIKRILQEKGDIVVTAPGTLHWVRSYGTALQSAWNLMPKIAEQIQCSLHRHFENKLVNFSKSGTIPLKSILIKYLNHEHLTMPTDSLIMITKAIENWLIEEEEHLLNMSLKLNLGRSQMCEYYLRDLESFCENCQQQVLVYFVRSWKQQGICCLQCLGKNQIVQNKSSGILYMKYSVYYIKKLLRLAGKGLLQGEILELCYAQHIGKISQCKNTGNTVSYKKVINKTEFEIKFKEKIKDSQTCLQVMNIIDSPNENKKKINNDQQTQTDEIKKTKIASKSVSDVSSQESEILRQRSRESKKIDKKPWKKDLEDLKEQIGLGKNQDYIGRKENDRKGYQQNNNERNQLGNYGNQDRSEQQNYGNRDNNDGRRNQQQNYNRDQNYNNRDQSNYNNRDQSNFNNRNQRRQDYNNRDQSSNQNFGGFRNQSNNDNSYSGGYQNRNNNDRSNNSGSFNDRGRGRGRGRERGRGGYQGRYNNDQQDQSNNQAQQTKRDPSVHSNHSAPKSDQSY